MNITIEIDLREKLAPARDQRQRPTCLVFAASAAHEFKRGPGEVLSPEYLFYSGAQRAHKSPDKGLTANIVREALQLDGQPGEEAWPYLDATPPASEWKMPTISAPIHKASLDFASRTVADVRTLLKSGVPVLLVISLTKPMYTPDRFAVVRAAPNDGVVLARHAVLAVGSGFADDGGYLLVRNSWGLRWGQAGHAWLHDSYLEARLEITGTIA
ncbi:MAG: C1 family peptidase [Polyangiaceae bacterium]